MNEYQLAAALWVILLGLAAGVPLAFAAARALHEKFERHQSEHDSDPSLPSIPSCPSSAG